MFMQAPFMHVPPLQAWPQAPQFALSEETSTQAFEQSI